MYYCGILYLLFLLQLIQPRRFYLAGDMTNLYSFIKGSLEWPFRQIFKAKSLTSVNEHNPTCVMYYGMFHLLFLLQLIRPRRFYLAADMTKLHSVIQGSLKWPFRDICFSDVLLWNQYKYIAFNILSCRILIILYKVLIITWISNGTRNKLTIYAILCWNVTIFYQQVEWGTAPPLPPSSCAYVCGSWIAFPVLVDDIFWHAASCWHDKKIVKLICAVAAHVSIEFRATERR